MRIAGLDASAINCNQLHCFAPRPGCWERQPPGRVSPLLTFVILKGLCAFLAAVGTSGVNNHNR
jgi:hypothetical protein